MNIFLYYYMVFSGVNECILNDYVYSAGLQFENNCDIGAFSKLTNAYCMVAIGGSEGFYRFFILFRLMKIIS